MRRRAVRLLAATALALGACSEPGDAVVPASAEGPREAKPVPQHAARLAATLLPLARDAEAAAAAGAGVVTGVALWAGSAPLKIKQLTNTADVAACGERVQPGSVVASPAGELAHVVVELRRASDPPVLREPISSATVAVAIERCLQVPHVLVVPLGASVEIENRDGILHELASLSVRNEPFLASLPRYRRRASVPASALSRPERIRVACETHPWAVSWWVVTGAAHHAVTDRTGRFRIEGVPAGTWELVAWHEELGQIERTVEVRASRPADVELAWR